MKRLDTNEVETRIQDEEAALDSDRRQLWTLAFFAIVAGIAIGVVGAGFRSILEHGATLRDGLAPTLRGHGVPGLLAAMAIVGLCAAAARWLVRFAPEAAGSGVQRVEAVMRDEVDPARFRVLPVKFIGGALAMGSGLALGREGPTVQMGGILGAWIARHARFVDADIRDFQAAVAGAGLGVAFGAPLGGTLFVFEEVRRAFTLRLSVATLLASATACGVAWLLRGGAPDFAVAVPALPGWQAALPILLLGAALGALGVAYNRVTVLMLDFAARAPRLLPEARAAIVGAMVGALLWYDPAMVGGGDNLTQAILAGQAALPTLVAILAVRWLLGPLSFTAGTPGGLFAPLMVVGAAGGALFAGACNTVAGLALDPVAFAIIGMSTFFVGVVRAPLTGIVLVVEMTTATTLMMPMLAAAGMAVAVATAMRGLPIYDTLRLRMLRSQARAAAQPDDAERRDSGSKA